MASIGTFICKECGYSCEANGSGFDRFKVGWFGYYSCKECEEVVSLRFPEIASDYKGVLALYRALGKILPCPQCEGRDLKPWGPKKRCPKCGGKMESSEPYILAD